MAGSFSRGRETRESAGKEGTSRSRSRPGSPERLQQLRNSAERERQDYINDPIRIEQQRVTAGEGTPEPGGSTAEEYKAWKTEREGKGIAEGKRKAGDVEEGEEGPETKRIKLEVHESDLKSDYSSYSSGSDDLFSEEDNNPLQHGGIKIEVTDGKPGENADYLQRAREKGVVIEVQDDQNNLPGGVDITHSPTGLEGQEDIPPEILAFLERKGELSGFPLGESSGSHFFDEISEGSGDSLEDARDAASEYIQNFYANDKNNPQALDAALKVAKVDRETVRQTIDNIQSIIDPDAEQGENRESSMAILQAANSQFKEIEEAIEKESSKYEK